MSESVPASQAPRVVLLGCDKFRGELAIALRRLGAEVSTIDGKADGTALTDPGALAAALQPLRPDFVVALTGSIPARTLEALDAELTPSARSVALTADREGLRKLAADQLGLPTAPFWFAGSLDELESVASHAGFPLLVRPVHGDVKPTVVKGMDDVEPAWKQAGGRVLAETVVSVEWHVTLLAAHTDGPDGPVIEFCSPIGHRGADADVLESWQPQNLSPAASDAARSIAARIVTALGGRGLFGVELMIDGDEVYFADVTATPRATALVTLRTQRLSAFELQARSILGMPVDTMMCSPGAARLVESHGAPPPDRLCAALRVPESDVRVFSSGAVVLSTAQDVTLARDGARIAAMALSGTSQS
jgi:phosphoribosylglycinamide formyltransferase 2